jgi:hypothetical protein
LNPPKVICGTEPQGKPISGQIEIAVRERIEALPDRHIVTLQCEAGHHSGILGP